MASTGSLSSEQSLNQPATLVGCTLYLPFFGVYSLLSVLYFVNSNKSLRLIKRKGLARISHK
jgi:hypothetical protein